MELFTSKPHDEEPTIRADKNAFVHIQYDGELDTAGSFNVRGKPLKPTLKSSNDKVAMVSGRQVLISGPGSATITVSLDKAVIELPIKVVELPIPVLCTQEQAVESLGFPTSKNDGAVLWPKNRTVDGVFYTTRADHVVQYSHWRFEKYPGGLLTWENDKFTLYTRDHE